MAGRDLLIGSNFNQQHVFQQVAGSTAAAAAHFAAGIVDHRGAVAYTPDVFLPLFGASSTSGTAAISRARTSP